MAGGIIIVLGLNNKMNEPVVGKLCGTGMHGGAMHPSTLWNVICLLTGG